MVRFIETGEARWLYNWNDETPDTIPAGVDQRGLRIETLHPDGSLTIVGEAYRAAG